MSYPATLPSYTVTAGSESANGAAGGTGLSGLLNAFETDITGIGTKIGTGASTPTNNTFLIGDGTGTSSWSSLTSAQLASRISDETGSGSLVFGSSPTIVTPTIASFTNATHTHANAAGGGQLGSTALTNFATNSTSTSNPYKFSAYRTAAANSGSGAFAKITFDTELFDTNNNFATGSYTTPVTGFYYFSWGVQASATVTSQTLIGSLYTTGGVEKLRGSRPVSRGADTLGSTGSGLVSLTAGDVIEIWVFGTAALAFDVNTPVPSNYFTGILMCQT